MSVRKAIGASYTKPVAQVGGCKFRPHVDGPSGRPTLGRGSPGTLGTWRKLYSLRALANTAGRLNIYRQHSRRPPLSPINSDPLYGRAIDETLINSHRMPNQIMGEFIKQNEPTRA